MACLCTALHYLVRGYTPVIAESKRQSFGHGTSGVIQEEIIMSIVYSEQKKIEQQALLGLYNNAGWTAYTNEPEKLVQAVQNSLCVLTAWDEENLVGLIRAVGDGTTILYIQDILVLQAYKRKGIGATLMAMMLEKFARIRQTILLTDDNEETRGFYEAMGFTSCDKGQLVAFAKLGNGKQL